MKPQIRVIEKTRTLRLPVFPLIAGKTTRKVTKHFTNLPMYMDREKFSFLSWLVYQCAVDNTIEYKHFLLERYAKSIRQANEFYSPSQIKLKTFPQRLRAILKELIEEGYVLSYNKRTLLISPILTYAGHISGKKHQKICERYLEIGVEDVKLFCDEWRKLIGC